MENLTVVSTIFWPYIVGNLSVFFFKFFFQQFVKSENPIFGSTIFCFALHCRQLSVVLILFSNGKSNRCLNNSFGHCIAGNLSVVSILFSNGKSNRCFNNFLTLHCKQSIHCFNSFVKWKIKPLFQQFF